MLILNLQAIISETLLFEHTKFARMGYANDKMVYYSAGMERLSTTASLE